MIGDSLWCKKLIKTILIAALLLIVPFYLTSCSLTAPGNPEYHCSDVISIDKQSYCSVSIFELLANATLHGGNNIVVHGRVQVEDDVAFLVPHYFEKKDLVIDDMIVLDGSRLFVERYLEAERSAEIYGKFVWNPESPPPYKRRIVNIRED